MTQDLRRHVATLEEAVEMIKAVRLLGGGANLYDMTGARRPHWIVEIYSVLPDDDWTVDEEEAAA